MSLRVTCPHCGHIEADSFEVLDVNCIEHLVCGSCRLEFHFSLMECGECEHETAFSWKRAPEPEKYQRLICARCMKGYHAHGTPEDDFQILG